MKFSRIYYKDRYTNEIWFYMAMPTRISLDYLEWYMKANNKKFLYITSIEYGSKEKASCNWWEYQNQCYQKIGKSEKKMKEWKLHKRSRKTCK